MRSPATEGERKEKTLKHVPAKHEVPPELIEEYERDRTVVQFEPGDLEVDDIQGFETVAGEAEYVLLESDLNREMWDELNDSVLVELRQRKGTKMLYVVEVSEDGKTVHTRASDGTY